MKSIAPKYLKLLGKTILVGSLMGSGSLIASAFSDSTIQYEEEELPKELIKPEQEYKGDQYITLTEYKELNFVEEGFSIFEGGKWIGQLYDHIHERNAEYIYYIKKPDEKKIRVSKERPNGSNSGIYSGWKLYEFNWNNNGKKWITWYGYCYPENDEKGEKCEDLPTGWTKKKI